jgi:5-formyltetrahydrofolate cyclo-ligase
MEGAEFMEIAARERKKEIRKHILKQRDAIPEEKQKRDSTRITESLVTLPAYREAEVIMAYCSYQSEADTQRFINKAFLDGKQVYVPKVSGDSMDFYRITCAEELKPGYKGIPEPDGGDVLTANYLSGKKALMLMPGAAFDRKHNRIGYGKGYYDKYLSGLRQELSDCERMPYMVAVCFSVQLVEQIPGEEHDIRPDRIVTELEIF